MKDFHYLAPKRDRPSEVCVVSEAELLSGLGYLRNETFMEGQPHHKLSSYERRFLVQYYIEIDVSKQTLKLFDGVKNYEISNERGLRGLKDLLKKNYGKE